MQQLLGMVGAAGACIGDLLVLVPELAGAVVAASVLVGALLLRAAYGLIKKA